MRYSRPPSAQSIAIYNDPALAQVGYSRFQCYQSIAINSDSAPAQVRCFRLHSYQSIFKVIETVLFTVISPLPRLGIPALKVTF